MAAGSPEGPVGPSGGTLRLAVDATDVARHLFRVRESIPAMAGAVTLLYPEWLPGYHSKAGSSIARLAGLRLSAAGRALEWQRDPVEMAAFHVDVPPGVTEIEAEFQFLTPVEGPPGTGRVVMTQAILALNWSAVLLYPAGYDTRHIAAEASVTLPSGWQFATALAIAAQSANTVHFKPVTLEELVDSPLMAGRNFKRIDLDPDAPVHVWLDVASERTEDLEIKPEQVAVHRKLVQQAYRLFDSHHYDHYDFLLGLSDQLGSEGLEHHQSSEDAPGADYFSAWDDNWADRDLLAHEFVHSWNGKFRRPAELATPNFNVPMKDSLLWLYEGQTEYWGYVLAARSGLMSVEQVRDSMALSAAELDYRSGRSWRNLQDTTVQDILFTHTHGDWPSWSRNEDYYSEGALIWLDADTRIRELSGGARSLDDFARAFFGIDNGSRSVVTYRFDDIVAALDRVEHYDWATFLRTRLDSHGPGAPLDGLARGGWELIYTDEPSAATKQKEQARGFENADFYFSLGLRIGKEGRIAEVRWDSPAFTAGLAPQVIVEAVNRVAYDPAALREAIRAARGSGDPIELIVRDGSAFRIVTLDYHDGLRYPHLVRREGTPDRLDQILAERR